MPNLENRNHQVGSDVRHQETDLLELWFFLSSHRSLLTGLQAEVHFGANQSGLHHGIINPYLHFFSDVYNGTVTFLPLEENSEGKCLVKKCNIYQIQLKHIKDEEW